MPILGFLDRAGAANLRLPLSTALLFEQRIGLARLSVVAERIGMRLLTAPAHDAAGAVRNFHTPVTVTQGTEPITALLRATPGAPVLFDAAWQNIDEEYRDVQALAYSTRNSTPAPGPSQSISRPKGSSLPE